MSNAWNKAKLIATIISAVFSNEKISEEELEDLKKADVMQNMMEELAKELPSVKSVLIDERDRYLATSIYLAPGSKKLAVVGAGHMGGIVKTIEALEQKQLDTDLEDISVEPKPGTGGKILSWTFPILIVSIIVFGFTKMSNKMFGSWLVVEVLHALVPPRHWPTLEYPSALSAPSGTRPSGWGWSAAGGSDARKPR